MARVSEDIYRERARLVAHLAALYPATVGTDPAAPEWPVVYVTLPEGQVSWHVAARDMDLFSHVPAGPADSWDGHDTDEKYGRLDRATRRLVQEAGR